MPTRFATDTAVVPLGSGRYQARIDPGWWIERGPNGEPVLTAKGRKTYTALESRDNVPEFDYAGEED